MKKNRNYIILGIIIIVIIAALVPVYQKIEGSGNTTPSTPITINVPKTTGFTFLYQVDNVHGSNCFHFTMPGVHISSLLFVVFTNVTTSGGSITVYNSTKCCVANFQLQPQEHVRYGEVFNISAFYPGNWSIKVDFSTSQENANYHFLAYYREVTD
ncbi:MAG: hypothetical protein ACYCSO_03025 [Cuniculiplasma sp.]